MLWTCAARRCGCRYAPAPCCPQCGSTKIKEKNVPKVNSQGVATNGVPAVEVAAVEPVVEELKKAKRGKESVEVVEPVEVVDDGNIAVGLSDSGHDTGETESVSV